MTGTVYRKLTVSFMAVAVAFVVGCAGAATSSKTTVVSNPPKAPANRHAYTPDPTPDPVKLLESKLRASVDPWIGTPHRMGGTSRRGIDCSGFVQQIYKEIFGKTLPRSSSLQVRAGKPIYQKELFPGDLVFFRPPYKKNHVGIYLGDKEFAHASTSKGVVISNLDDGYWRSCYWTARRYQP